MPHSCPTRRPSALYEATLAGIEPAPESIISDSSIVSSGSSGSAASSSASEAIYYIGTFDIANPDHRLRTYMTAEVQIVLQEARDVLAIPAAALIGGGRAGGYSVQVVDAAGQVGERPVEVGLNNKISVEVRDGLREGERVVNGVADGGAPAATGRGRRGPLGV